MAGRERGQPQRESCETVGASMRAAVVAATSNRLTDIQHRVLLAILVLTASWTKLEDTTCVAEIARLAGLNPDKNGDQRSVRRALAKLVELGCIDWEPARGRGGRSTLRLLGPTTPEEASRNGSEASVKPDTLRVQLSERENRTNGSAKTGHPGCPTTEEKELLVLSVIGKSRQAGGSLSRTHARGGDGGSNVLPACSELHRELQDEEQKSGWVGGGELIDVPVSPATVEANRLSEVVAVADHEERTEDDDQVGGAEPPGPEPPEQSSSSVLDRKLDELGPVNSDVRRLVHRLAGEFPDAIVDFLRRAGDKDIICAGAWLGMVLPEAAGSGELRDLQATLERPVTTMDEPQRLTSARAFFTTFQHDYPDEAMRDELEHRYPSLGPGDLDLIFSTPIDTPTPPPPDVPVPVIDVDEETTTLNAETRAALPWKLKRDRHKPTDNDHEQTQAGHERLNRERDQAAASYQNLTDNEKAAIDRAEAIYCNTTQIRSND